MLLNAWWDLAVPTVGWFPVGSTPGKLVERVVGSGGANRGEAMAARWLVERAPCRTFAVWVAPRVAFTPKKRAKAAKQTAIY